MKPNIIVYPEDFWIKQYQHTERSDVETMAFGFLGVNRCDEKNEYLVFDNYLPADNEFGERSLSGVTLHVDSVCAVLKMAKNACGIVDFHNHPNGCNQFSSTDDKDHHLQKQQIQVFSQQGILVRMIRERDNYRAEVFDPKNGEKFEAIDMIKIISNSGFNIILPINSRLKRHTDLNEKIAQRHIRTSEFCPPERLSLMQDTHIGIIGLGGNGSALVNMLKFFPFKRWTLVDSDIVEEHNANRLFGYKDGDVGKYKVDIIKRELLQFDPETKVEAVKRRFPDKECIDVLKNCDILIVSPDNNFARYMASEFAMRYLKPLLELGSGLMVDDEKNVTAIGSQMRFQVPSENSQCIVCSGLDVTNLETDEMRQHKKDIGYIEGSDESPGSVVTINSIAATVAAHLIINFFTGYIHRENVPAFINYDEKELTINDYSPHFKKKPDCNICGRHSNSIFGRGDVLPAHQQVLEPV